MLHAADSLTPRDAMAFRPTGKITSGVSGCIYAKSRKGQGVENIDNRRPAKPRPGYKWGYLAVACTDSGYPLRRG